MSFQYENREEENQPQQISPEEFLAERKKTIRRRSWWAIGIGAVLVAFHLLVFSVIFLYQEQLQAQYPEEFDGELSWKLLFRSIFFILGIFAVLGGLWGLREAKRIKIEDFIPTPEAIAFAKEGQNVTPYFTYILLACIVAVYLAQYFMDSNNPSGKDELPVSIQIAGLVKPLVRNNGEYWRIMTGALLHYWLLHIYFNGQALFGFGSLIEYLSNRAHLSIVFVLSIVGGGFFSLLFMPNITSVGASGGIMGLIGYLAVYGYRRKQQLPPDFLKSMLINIGFIAAFGLVAYQIIDNFAHLGGFLIGVVYGYLQVPRDLSISPRRINAVTEAFGYLAMGLIVFSSIFTILMLLRYIVL
jgi:membrane associated rhomboid family serine protease